MAVLGTVASVIAPDNVSGTVTASEDGTNYRFLDTNFPNTGLQVGDECCFDLDCSGILCTASNLQPIEVEKIVITDPIDGDQTVGQNQKMVIKAGGVVNGNVTVNGGALVAKSGGTINGNITVNDGGQAKSVDDGVFNGNATINNPGSSIVVKTSTMTGDVSVDQTGAGFVRSGGNINGNITVRKDSQFKVNDGGNVNGDLDVGETGADVAVQIGGNINGNITVTKDYKHRIHDGSEG